LPREFYFAYLSFLVPGFGFEAWARLMASGCGPEVVSRVFRLDKNWPQHAEDWLAQESRYSKVIWPKHIDYPDGLYHIEKPPLFLFIEGELKAPPGRRLAVVGAREVHAGTSVWIEKELGAFVREHDLTVVSGGARGVDQKAHFLAIRNARPTWVILPS